MRWNLLAVVVCCSLTASCGPGGVQVTMGTLPTTSEMGDLLGRSARLMSCQVRGNRARLVIRCPSVAYAGRRVDVIVSDEGTAECVARQGFESDCRPVYEFLVGQSASAGGPTQGPTTEPPVGTVVFARLPTGWYRATVVAASDPGSVVVDYDDDYQAIAPNESVTLDRIRLR